MCPLILLISVLMLPLVNLFPGLYRETTRKPLGCSEQVTITKVEDRSSQKSFKSPVGPVNLLPSWSETGSYLGSPAMARVQYCCVVLQRPLVQADVFCLAVAKLQEEAKHDPSELIWWSYYSPSTAPLWPGSEFLMQRPWDPHPRPQVRTEASVCEVVTLATKSSSGWCGYWPSACDPHTST